MCLYPKIIKNKKYTANKKNGGVITPPSDYRVMYVTIGCGVCMECMKKKAREWKIRMSEEIRENKTGKFITLTFEDKYYDKVKEQCEIKIDRSKEEEVNIIAKKAMRLFLERWRKKYKKSVRHWVTTELGHNGTERLHMHGILWTDKTEEEIKERWGYGYVYIGEYVNDESINYITKYMTKIDEKHKNYKPIILTSAGIGAGYNKRQDANNNKYKEGNTNENYRFRNGRKSAMPIYYRNKIYNEEEREKLWLEKIEKKERWIGGEKIKANNNNIKEQINLLKYYRDKSKKLGYREPKDRIKNEKEYWEMFKNINKEKGV